MKWFEVNVIDRELPTAFYAVSRTVATDNASFLFGHHKVICVQQINEYRALKLLNEYREKHELPLIEKI